MSPFNLINRFYNCTYDDLGDMLCLPRLGHDNTLMTFDHGRGIRTQLFDQLLTEALRHGARLAVIDTLSDVFAGNEIDRSQSRQFVQSGLGYMAREINGSVVACAHPSLSGITTGSGNSGSTGWPGAFRSHLYTEIPKPEKGEEQDPADTDQRVLTRKKSNWAKPGDFIEMKWSDGVFVTDTPVAPGFAATARKLTARRVFLELLDKYTAINKPLSDSKNAGDFAPKVFASDPGRQGVKRSEFEAAMNDLAFEHPPKIVFRETSKRRFIARAKVAQP